MNEDERRSYIVALLEERAVCHRHGQADRVQQIDVELQKAGHEARTGAKRAESRPRVKKTETR